MVQGAKYATPADEALETAVQTRDKIINGSRDVVSILRSCLIVAQDLKREKDAEWIYHELNGYYDPSQLTRNGSPDIPDYRIFSLRGKGEIQFREGIDELLTFVRTGREYSESLNRDQLRVLVYHIEKMTGEILSKCFDFLNSVVMELQFSNKIEGFMESIRSQTDERLGKLGEAMRSEMQSLHANLTSTNPADWSKVGHSCRRMLELLADHVFPPRDKTHVGKDGKSHPITKQDYLNRLIAFIDERTSGDTRSLLIAEADKTIAYLDHLNIEICSIEHGADVGKYDVDLAAIRTYLLASEILRLKRNEKKTSDFRRGNYSTK